MMCWIYNPDWWVAGFTGLLFIVGLGQVILFLRQLRFIGKSLEDTTKAANAAGDSANAAKDTVALMKDTAERELRAYVFANDVNLEQINNGNEHRIKVSILNSGQTPAYGVTSHFHWSIESHNLDAALTWEPTFPSADTLGSKGAIASNKELHIRQSLTISENDRIAIQAETKILHIYGIVKYTDAFGKFRYTKYHQIMSSANVQHGKFATCASANEVT